MRYFYTPERTTEIERVAPGWTDMAAYADGATRNHVSQALIALQLLPEYRQASRHLQSMMEWKVLYHDPGSIQDYRALPEIRDGIERLYGAGSAAALIVQSDAWQLFERDVRARFRASTLAAFANVRRVLVE